MARHCERLRYALTITNMKPSMLSYKTGISEASISHYLAGHYVPKTNKMQAMATALKVSEGWLSGYDVPMHADQSAVYDENSPHGVKIPVLGKVAAGIPIEAITEILDYEEIDSAMLKDGSEYFALQIKGDSMEPRIKDGDVVIVRRQPTVDNGQIAVVCINGSDATCKKIKLETHGIFLIPFNSAYEPMYYSNQDILDIPVTILGKVVELRAKFN